MGDSSNNNTNTYSTGNLPIDKILLTTSLPAGHSYCLGADTTSSNSSSSASTLKACSNDNNDNNNHPVRLLKNFGIIEVQDHEYEMFRAELPFQPHLHHILSFVAPTPLAEVQVYGLDPTSGRQMEVAIATRKHMQDRTASLDDDAGVKGTVLFIPRSDHRKLYVDVVWMVWHDERDFGNDAVWLPKRGLRARLELFVVDPK